MFLKSFFVSSFFSKLEYDICIMEYLCLKCMNDVLFGKFSTPIFDILNGLKNAPSSLRVGTKSNELFN